MIVDISGASRIHARPAFSIEGRGEYENERGSFVRVLLDGNGDGSAGPTGKHER
jgi:hypothetical protein